MLCSTTRLVLRFGDVFTASSHIGMPLLLIDLKSILQLLLLIKTYQNGAVNSQLTTQMRIAMQK